MIDHKLLQESNLITSHPTAIVYNVTA